MLGVAGGNLQLIAQRLNNAETIAEAEVAASLAAFRAAASAIMRLLGKRPHDY
jgi:hypothetical protein